MMRDCSTAMKPVKSGFMAAPSPSIEPQSVECEEKSVESLTRSVSRDTFCLARVPLSEGRDTFGETGFASSETRQAFCLDQDTWSESLGPSREARDTFCFARDILSEASVPPR